jgi:hypothetical protein
MTVSRGNAGCPCINVTQELLSLSDRYCSLDNGDRGVQLTVGGACVSPTFGSSYCLQHDMIHDPACSNEAVSQTIVIPYCFRPWCYVDHESCMRDSDERVYRSSYFDVDSGIDVYFSYSTCNSTAADWYEAQGVDLTPRTLGGAEIVCNAPTFIYPGELPKGPFLHYALDLLFLLILS